MEFEGKTRQWLGAHVKKQAALFFGYGKPGISFARISFDKYIAGGVYESASADVSSYCYCGYLCSKSIGYTYSCCIFICYYF
jgi:hypothetical protein